MSDFSMTCSCGETMACDAESRDKAVEMLRSGMTQAALDEHFAKHHPGASDKPTLEQAHAMIGATLVAV